MKKGFTLIELLAVIVILAIISLIAVPIVINIINDSKYESQKRSIDHYAEALKQSVADYQLKNNKKVEGKFNTTDGKTLTREDITLNVDYKGNVVCNRIVVNKDGSIYLSECTVDDDKVYISKEESKKENPSYYEYGKTEYGMIMENKTHSYNFLNTGIYGGLISSFIISNILDIKDKETYESSDCSYNKDGSVICFWKKIENEPGYKVILVSDGEIYTPYDSSYLFYKLGAGQDNRLHELDLSKLNTKKTTNMSYMFSGVGHFLHTINFGNNFDTSNVTNMKGMFSYFGFGYSWQFKLPDTFDTSKVIDMSHMFDSAFYYGRSLDLGDNFDTSNVIDMSYMFNDMAPNYFSNLDLGDNFDTSKVTNMSHMFAGIASRSINEFSLNLGDNFDTSNVTNMSCMLCNLSSISNSDFLQKFNTSKVTDMSYMFADFGTKNISNINLGANFDTSNVTNMRQMFSNTGHDSMTSLNLGDKFDTSKVINMFWMFKNTGYNRLEKLDLGKKFVANVPSQNNNIEFSNIFEGTGHNSMKELDLWNFSGYTRVASYRRNDMFKDCGTEGVLTKVVVSSDSFKNTLINDSNVPQFWKDNNIIQVQAP